MIGNTTPFKRVVLIVLDGAGIGEMPDAADWGDAGSDTFGHICESRQMSLPNLQGLGLGNIRALAGVPAVENPRGCYGKCALKSNGKDTTTGLTVPRGATIAAPPFGEERLLALVAAYQAVTDHHLKRPPNPTVTASARAAAEPYKVPADYDASEES